MLNSHDTKSGTDPDLAAAFAGKFVPIVRQMYDEATKGLELYQ